MTIAELLPKKMVVEEFQGYSRSLISKAKPAFSCIEPVPEQTAQIAHAALPKGSPYVTLRDGLGTLYHDDSSTLFPARGQPAFPPWRLALVTILQFRENLSDRQAAEAVRARIDWKYLLGLELADSGFDFSVLCEFRERLIAGVAEMRLLDELLVHSVASWGY